MSASEFELIQRYFASATPARGDVLLGIGDDCALLEPGYGEALAVSIDTLVSGHHFRADVDPESLGHKALAVNLSDLAAMGARPAWVTLALTLPDANEDWLGAFMRGFAALANTHGIQLVGGDTTRGPLSITVQVHGFVPTPAALRRAGGRVGDRLFVSGTVGDAGAALQLAARGQPVDPALQARLDRPEPRLALARLLAGNASAAIDVSDGLAADLGHLCTASGVGAWLELAKLPLSTAMRAQRKADDWSAPLSGGDDYELLFSVGPERIDALLEACRAAGETVTEIGRLVDGAGVTLVHPDGHLSEETPDGFDHFRE